MTSKYSEHPFLAASVKSWINRKKFEWLWHRRRCPWFITISKGLVSVAEEQVQECAVLKGFFLLKHTVCW
jgi:hypothetical protein